MRTTFLTVLLLLAAIGFAEEWMTFTTDDGLAHDICRCVAVDHDGVVWVGHGDVFSGVGGVSSWDGETWTTYHSWTTDFALRSDYINDIAVDENNNKWFATGTVLFPGGLTKFDGTDWTRFDFDTLMPMGENLYCTIVEHNNSSIYSIFGSQIIKMEHGTIIYSYTFPESMTAFFPELDLSYVGTNVGLYVLDYPYYFLLDSTFVTYVLDVKKYDSSIYLATDTAGLFIISDFRIEHFDTTDNIISNSIRKVFIDSNSILWIGSYRGVSKFYDSIWIDYRLDDSYPTSAIKDFSQDENHNIFIATTNGLSIYNEDVIRWSIQEENFEASNTPFCSEYLFSLEDDNEISNIRVYDIRGKLISKQNSVDELKKNIQNYNSGLYLINLQVNDKPFCFKYVNIK